MRGTMYMSDQRHADREHDMNMSGDRSRRNMNMNMNMMR